jgi:hypothetical protein
MRRYSTPVYVGVAVIMMSAGAYAQSNTQRVDPPQPPAFITAGPNPQGTTPGTYAPNVYERTHASMTGTYTPRSYQEGTYRSTNPGTEVMPNGPQGTPPSDWAAQQNVIQSKHYTWQLQHNRAFREARMRKECGPITDPQLHQSCVESFDQYSPWAGNAPTYGSSSSTPHQSDYGR